MQISDGNCSFWGYKCRYEGDMELSWQEIRMLNPLAGDNATPIEHVVIDVDFDVASGGGNGNVDAGITHAGMS